MKAIELREFTEAGKFVDAYVFPETWGYDSIIDTLLKARPDIQTICNSLYQLKNGNFIVVEYTDFPVYYQTNEAPEVYGEYK